MTHPNPAQLLSIEGADATTFAQAQFSSKVTLLPNGRWQFSAWLDAQGRVRALFHLARLDDGHLLLLLRGGDARHLAEELQRYVFRSRVRLTPSTTTGSLGSGTALPMQTVQHDGDHVLFGCGNHSLSCGAGTSVDDAWRRMQLHEGWAWLPGDVGSLLPPALSLYRLQAVALDKGCYPGQEIVARLHYRGGHKRHLHRIALSQAMPEGSTLHLDGGEIIQLLQTVHGERGIDALAIMSDTLAQRLADGRGIVLDEGVRMRIEASWSD